MEKYNNIIAASLLSIGLVIAAVLYRQPTVAPVPPTPIVEPDYMAVASQTITDPRERHIRSALYSQLAESLTVDNGQRITDTDALGQVLEASQRYRFGEFDPNKYEQLSETVGSEFARQLGCEDESQPLTPERIRTASEFFLSLARALK